MVKQSTTGNAFLKKTESYLYVRQVKETQKTQCCQPTEKGAQITKASHFDYEFLLGHKIVFICEAKGDPQPRINWFKDDIELYAHPFIKITEWQLKHKHIKSKLQITPARQMDSGMYECQANNKYSIDSRSFKADFSTISK
ncbi:immunoglobulin domain-containing protein oig-4-like isoform X1 [Centruroides sculpturatus]|uniref:immunoglobulin domain-containing protein oig-4-like isoform X1 n=1 Tax=Centruroides sculpturatus TaxID=218467 RepID=UPI000C6CD5FD|nr:immunoglobulin domain-containing protein oig-4-like isoform X1 [Centruroides sculpturatus]